MTIKIAHLYYDLMNLYGENGNIRALVKHFENQGIKCKVEHKTVNDNIKFDHYDAIYMGMSSEENQLIVLNDIVQYKDEIKKYIKDNKLFIATGNSYELFGKYIEDTNGSKYECLNIFNYYATRINKRISEEQIYKTNLIEKFIVGFQNRGSIINIDNNWLFEVINGTGNKPNDIHEGYHEYQFYGTYLVGPLLIRNPYFTDYLIEKFCLEHKHKFSNITNDMEYKAYDQLLINFAINEELLNKKSDYSKVNPK